jgi:DNA helicase HerA-like ATPase
MVQLDAQQLLSVCETIAEGARAESASPACQQWLASEDGRHQAIAKMLRGWDGVGGWKLLTDLTNGYHSAAANTDYQNDIYEDLIAGKVVIVDLARGEESVQRFASERIITHLLARAAHRFRQGEEAHHMQVFLEEAHILFDRDKAQKEGTRDPYVRLAREAGKYKIGMVYATQQVSSVAPDILDNTANWIVAHLNSEGEVKHLRGRYEFDRFAEQIKTAEDKGFVRIKTLSSRYVIPVQVRLFNAEMVAQARAAEAGVGHSNGGLI